MIKPLSTNKFLSDDELTRLKASAAPLKPTRDDLLIQVALATGARASEVLNTKKADYWVSGKQASVFIQGLKGSRSRTIPIPVTLAAAVLALPVGADDRPFPITYTRLFQIWDLYRPNGKKFHAIRHTFAINLYRSSRDLRLVQNALGHSDIKNTMIYLDFVHSDEELRKHLKL